MQPSHRRRSGAEGALPHFVHRPAATRSAVWRLRRARSPARAFSGSRRGAPAARSFASLAREALLRLAAQGSQTLRAGAGGRSPQRRAESPGETLGAAPAKALAIASAAPRGILVRHGRCPR